MTRNLTPSLQFTVVATLLLLVTSCGNASGSKPELKAGGRVEGTLTINGKTEALKHAYARRVSVNKDGEGAAIEVLLASQPISDAQLTRIFAEMDKDSHERDEGLKGVVPRALHFRIRKEDQSPTQQRVFFTGLLVMAEGIIGGSETNQFQEFDLQRGVVKAKAEKQWEDTDRDGKLQDIKYVCSYSLSFEVSMGEATAREIGPDLFEGAAKGTMRSKDGSAALRYSYAWRERLFFDEPEERIVVLVTNNPIPKGAEAAIKKGEASPSRHGLQGVRFMTNEFGKLYWGHVYDAGGLFLNTNRFKNVEWAVQNGRVIGKADFDKRADDKEGFSVAFDAPLKD